MSKRSSIIIVEDDPSQAELLRHWLTEAGYSTTLYTHARALIRQAHSIQSAQLLILDWDLPDLSGEDILAWINSRGLSIPIIFNTVHDFEGDVVSILNAGADDYLIKPTQKSILLARVSSVLRRAHKGEHRPANITLNGITLNRLQHCITHNADKLNLGEKEFSLLWELALHEGKVLMRKRLLSIIWGYDERVETRSLDVYVSKIRQMLKKLPAPGWNIHSVYGAGYRLEISTDSPVSPD